MNIEQYNTIKELVKEYMNTLTVKECRDYVFKNGILTSNSKLSKGDNFNYGLELLPSNLSGYNTCPNAGLCKLSCIAFTGQGNVLKGLKMFNKEELSSPLMAKARRTFLFLNDREFFDSFLMEEIRSLHAKSVLFGYKASFRLNVTSDINWFYITNEMSNVSFYDYTKVWSRESSFNYHLTFSASEHTSIPMIKDKCNSGENVAMVFNSVPNVFEGIEVISGDDTDNRYEDKKGVVIGLTYKTSVGGKDKDSSFVF